MKKQLNKNVLNVSDLEKSENRITEKSQQDVFSQDPFQEFAHKISLDTQTWEP